jgi:hypothetical protein
MSTVFIECPCCGSDIDTHIAMDALTFDRLPRIEGRMVCPTCRAENCWDQSMARLADDLSEAEAA